MRLIAGLGNPGKKYATTRHNIGFMVLDTLAKELKVKFVNKSKLKADIVKTRAGRTDIVLAKPTDYMNLSGRPIGNIASFYKIKPADVWLVYDDIDIEYGFIKIKPFGSAAGHNGVNSVIEHLGTQKFPRFRVGIKPSEEESKKARYHKLATARFVLQDFSPDQKKILDGIIKETTAALLLALKKGLPESMNQYN